MRKKMLGSALAGLIGLCGMLSGAPSVHHVSLEGFVAELPAESGWTQTGSGPTRVRFERAKDDALRVVWFASEAVAPLPDDEDFLRHAEDQEAMTLSAFVKVSVHYYRVREQDTACLKYDGIFEDKVASATPFVTIKGRICRHPSSANRWVQMELSQRSDSRAAAYALELAEEAEQIFRAVEFVELDPTDR